MPFYLVHAGSAIQKMSVAGDILTLALPVGVTISTDRPARFGILNGMVVVTNAPSVNLSVDGADFTVRILNIAGPATPPTLAGGGAGAVSGVIRGAYTYLIKDGTFILSESPMSPLGGPLTLANNSLAFSNITTSSNASVNARRLYRTLNEGLDLWATGDIDDNTGTSLTVNVSNYDLSLLPSTEPRGNPPGFDSNDRMRLITAWQDRLFGVGILEPDIVHYSGNRAPYSWGPDATIRIGAARSDEWGVTGFMSRRDELVIGRRRQLYKLIGDSPLDYTVVRIADGIGMVSQDAGIVVHDDCYFLAEDGYYEYGPNGVTNLSRERVHPWFTTDDFFNRSLFHQAFAKYNALYDTVSVHLAAAGSTDIDRWIVFDRRTREWFGPHLTNAFTPTCGGAMDDLNGFNSPVMGASNAFLYRENRPLALDDTTQIPVDVIMKDHSANTPKVEKRFGRLTLIHKQNSSSSLLIVTPHVGDLGAAAQSDIQIDLAGADTQFPYLGAPGRYVRLRFRHTSTTEGEGVTIYGYEIPFSELGVRR